MTFKNILLNRKGPITTLTVNRPNVMNALNSETLRELAHAIVQCGLDHEVRVVVLTGAGPKAFVAGADVTEFQGLTPLAGQMLAREGQRVFDLIERLGKPVIAAVNGYALGGGCELAMACTLRLASSTARFGQPEVNLGVMTGYAGSQRLVRLVGYGIALDLLLTGRQINADEALAIGLVSRVVPQQDLLEIAQKLASDLAAKPPLAVRCVIEAVMSGRDSSFDVGQRLEATLFGLLMSTEDKHEGTEAFLNKRTPAFVGR